MTVDLKLRVRNFLGVAAVDIDIAGITLVGGGNGAGKSSLLEAAGCASTMNPLARGLRNKKAAIALMADGKEAGAVKLQYREADGGAGDITIAYPACSVAQTGKPVHMGSALGIGVVSYASLSADQRAAEITARFETVPTLADLVAWFKEHPCGLQSDDIKAMMPGIEDQGWDAYHKAAVEHGTKIKGAWERITKRRFGTAIAKTWMPAGLLEGEDYDPAAEAEVLQRLKDSLELLASQRAVSADFRRRLETDAARVDELETTLQRIEDETAVLNQRGEELIAERSHFIDAADAHNSLKCPHCKKRVQYDPKGGERGTLHALKGAPTWDEIQDGRAAIARIDEERKGVVERLEKNAREAATVRAELLNAQRARKTLDEIANLPVADDQAIAAARQAVVDQELKCQAVDRLGEAMRIAEEFAEHEHVIAAVAPGGVRSVVLRRKLSEINAKLAEISSTARFPDVQLNDDLEPLYAGRAYALISESERWRVDLAMQVLLAEQEGAKLLLVDRLDVLEPDARPGVLKMLKARGIPTLMACTARDQAALPDLARAKFGSVHWLAKGRLADAA